MSSALLRRPAVEPPELDPIGPAATAVQPKLAVGAPDDPLEREADRVAAGASANSVHSATAPTVSRAPVPDGGSLGARITSPTGGRPMTAVMRGDMEDRLGADFSGVRIHDSEQDRGDADRLGARAFTHKQDIWLGGKGSVNDRGLIAHELTHVVQQTGDLPRKTPDEAGRQPVVTATGDKPDVQGAWYNVSIPFTDYEFDPSISGVTTAAGVVKDAAVDSAVWVKDKVVAGLEWVYDRIVSVVTAGTDWLNAKYADIKNFAGSAFDSIGNGVRALLRNITSPAEMLTAAVKMMNGDLLGSAWKLLQAGVTLVWQGIRSTIDAVLSTGTGIWDAVSSFVSGLFGTITGILDSWPFRQLPQAVQSAARRLVDGVRALWEEIRDYLSGLLQRLRAYADQILAGIGEFADNVTSFGVDAVLSTMRKISEAWEFVKRVAADPVGFVSPYVDRLAARLNTEAPPKAVAFGEEKLRDTVPAESTGVVVQRQPEPGRPERSITSPRDVITGFTKAIGEAWAQLDISEMLWDSLKSLIFPFPGIAREFHDLWSTDWANAVSSFFAPRWPFGSWADFAGFWHDIWSNILVVLEFPLALSRRLTNVLMLLSGLFTLLVVGLGAVVGGPAGAGVGLALASAVGLGLLKVYLLNEGVSFVKAVIDLITTRQTQTEKNRDYVQMAGSLLGVGVALTLMAALFVLSAVVNGVIAVVKRVRMSPVATTTGTPVEPPKAGSPVPTETKPPVPAETGPTMPSETGPTKPTPKETAPTDAPGETPAPRMQEPIREMESGRPIEFGPRHAEALRQNAAAATDKWLKMYETQGRVPWESIRNQMKLSRWRFLPEAPEAAAILRDAVNRLPAGAERTAIMEMLERWTKGGNDPGPAGPSRPSNRGGFDPERLRGEAANDNVEPWDGPPANENRLPRPEQAANSDVDIPAVEVEWGRTGTSDGPVAAGGGRGRGGGKGKSGRQPRSPKNEPDEAGGRDRLAPPGTSSYHADIGPQVLREIKKMINSGMLKIAEADAERWKYRFMGRVTVMHKDAGHGDHLPTGRNLRLEVFDWFDSEHRRLLDLEHPDTEPLRAERARRQSSGRGTAVTHEEMEARRGDKDK
ncbi:eCIS core domain-containing protein [Couchioplanes caeruleus]|uniref:Uncharacterized protein DUF4157 n=1 Tax=Couchioplanes caeruleus TaxID=56438 RepID=A0A3N1GDQ5_9ACTN|nr:DUF4157 domain-containing protein [Couchioplanes caeruleus]ROP28315.1 uncharacterized protein DUF4157 [Couchioplanes caeruleus]